MSKTVLRCPHIKPDGKRCGNIIMRYGLKDIVRATLYCRTCKTEWDTHIEDNEVKCMKEALGRVQGSDSHDG